MKATLDDGGAPRPNQSDPLSPLSRRDKVRKPSKETRRLLELLRINVDKVKRSSSLAAASQVILESLSSSDPWQGLTSQELLEKFENHAEALLNDVAFLQLLKGWPGIDEMKSFCADTNWWKRRPNSQGRLRTRQGRRIQADDSVDLFEVQKLPPMDIVDINSSQENAHMETPAPRYPKKAATKGTSSLRPRLSMSQTPSTPIPQMDNHSIASDLRVDSENDSSDDDLQLLKVPPDISRREQHEEKISRKRKPDEVNETTFTQSKRNRSENPTILNSIKFGRGRPSLTTVPVIL